MKSYYRNHKCIFNKWPSDENELILLNNEQSFYDNSHNGSSLIFPSSSVELSINNKEIKNEIIEIFNQLQYSPYDVYDTLDKIIEQYPFNDLSSSHFNMLLSAIDSYDILHSQKLHGINLEQSGFAKQQFTETFMLRNWAYKYFICYRLNQHKLRWETKKDLSDRENFDIQEWERNPLIISEWLNSAYHHSINDIINFGKYKGGIISDVLKTDPNYVLWCIINLKPFILVSIDTFYSDSIIQKQDSDLFTSLNITTLGNFNELLLKEAQMINDIKTKIFYSFISVSQDIIKRRSAYNEHNRPISNIDDGFDWYQADLEQMDYEDYGLSPDTLYNAKDYL